jgi:hypothetical protein
VGLHRVRELAGEEQEIIENWRLTANALKGGGCSAKRHGQQRTVPPLKRRLLRSLTFDRKEFVITADSALVTIGAAPLKVVLLTRGT